VRVIIPWRPQSECGIEERGQEIGLIETYVGLGSNLGNRMGNLATALAHLGREPGVSVRRVSSVYETEPVGPPQPRYLNAVAQVGTLLSPRALWRLLVSIEEKLGRFRRERWGPREIDLDLLLYGDRVLRGAQLTVPHPHLHERGFVLVPLCELAPAAMHPGLHRTCADLRAALPESDLAGVRRLGPLRRRYDLPEDGEDDEPGDAPAGGATTAKP
jgi:2-amino-4-hydroxy-6-hydroxymethyldihydropteridine diphosphokinase